MNDAQAEEVIKKRLANRWWRLNSLYWVRSTEGRLLRFVPNWAQADLYVRLWYLNVVLKVRQIGISTFFGILQLDRCLFTASQTCGIIDRTDEEAVKKLAKVRATYEQLDNVADPRTAPLGQSIKQAVRLVKKNDHQLEWSNGSQLWAGVSLRGDTLNFLHVSEMGYIAEKDPKRAEEIASGSFNTVHPGNFIACESTHRGGRFGLNYELIRHAQRCPPKPSMLDWRFHFYPWFLDPANVLEVTGSFAIDEKSRRYFAELEKCTGVRLKDGQKLWWMKKSRQPKVQMDREFPGTVEEALSARVDGAIYGEQMHELRQRGRVREFEFDRTVPLFSFSDLGQSDYRSTWFVQFVKLDILVLRYTTAKGEDVGQFAAMLAGVERMYQRPIRRHFLPHDAAQASKLGPTFVQALAAAGVSNVTVVPVVPDVWVGIKHARAILPRCYFHARDCAEEVELESGRILPSGLSALEGYHTKTTMEGGRVIEKPEHDASSHGADAFRVLAEADMRQMLDPFKGEGNGLMARPTAIVGPTRAQRFVERTLARPIVIRG